MKRKLVACLLLLTMFGTLFSACGKEKRTGDLTVEFMQTGKSDCILLYTADTTVLIDTGYAENADTIARTLADEKVKTIHHLILTHYDKDHIGSAAYILQNYNVGQVYLPDGTATSQEYYALQQALSTGNVPVSTVTEDTTLTLAEGCTLRINPTHLTGEAGNETYDNNLSLITSVRWGNFGLLLMGDALKDRVEEYAATDTSAYQIIKLPHHGDYYKKLENYIVRTGAKNAVICCGDERAVDTKLTEMCSDLGITLFRTDEGAVRLTYNASDGTYLIAHA